MFTNKKKWKKHPIKIHGECIPYKKQVKYLGVILDSKLSGLTHGALYTCPMRHVPYALYSGITSQYQFYCHVFEHRQGPIPLNVYTCRD